MQFQVQSIFEANHALARAITASSLTVRFCCICLVLFLNTRQLLKLTAPVLQTKQMFPNVSVPAFEVIGFEARDQAAFESIAYAPVASDVDQWIAFSSQHSSWVQESQSIYRELDPDQNRSSSTLGSQDFRLPMSQVWRRNDTGSLLPWFGEGIFYPVMHTSPPPFNPKNSILNLDLLSIPSYDAIVAAAAMLKGELKLYRWHLEAVRSPCLT